MNFCNQTVIDGVLDRFYAMCAFPHGSWNEEKLVSWMEGELRSRGWSVLRDTVGNLRAEIPASPGKENAPLTVVQGHLDMVCAHGADWDPKRDTVNAFVEDGVLRTDLRSSLGADNNLGNAAALYVLDSEFVHGSIRLLLTVAEEVGLQGASRLDPAWTEGARYLINTDGFKLGRAVIASAGGRREEFTRTTEVCPARLEKGWKVEVTGSLGGHSGYDIDRGRANCTCLLALFLETLREELDYELAELKGGHALNAIPLEASARILTGKDGETVLRAAAAQFGEKLRSVYGNADPGIRITVREESCPETVMTGEDRDRLLLLIGLLHNGVFSMHDTIPGLVAASSNTGVVEAGQGEAKVVNYTRSAREFDGEMILRRHRRAADLTGYLMEHSGYPSWNGDRNAPLILAMSRIYREISGEELEVTGVHVGLEPAVLGAMNPDMEMVVVGPDILDPHSVNERAPVEGLPVYTELLRRTLEWIGEQ